MLKVVYDTNIIVSAILKPGSLPDSLLSLALQDRVKLCISQAIFDEYFEVLHRPKFRLTTTNISRILQSITDKSLLVLPEERILNILDEEDSHILECAVTAHAHYLVTGNIKHFPAPQFRQIRIVSPGEFALLFFNA